MDDKILRKISYGLFVITSNLGKQLNGQIANVFFQVASQPPKFAIALNKENLTCKFVKESGVFAACVLEEETPMTFIGKFGFKSGRDTDKFIDTKHRSGTTGAAIILENTLGWIECRVVGSMDVGTHILFVGEAVDMGTIKEGKPLTYAYYHESKKGKSPEKAPTYIKEGT